MECEPSHLLSSWKGGVMEKGTGWTGKGRALRLGGGREKDV